MTDEQFRALLADLRRMDRAVFDAVVRDLLHVRLPPVVRRILRAGGCQAACVEDVVQEALVCTFQAVDMFRGSTVGEFTVWGTTIARRRAFDHLKRCAARQMARLTDLPSGGDQEVAGGAGVLDAVTELELMERIRAGLELIPPPQADALRLWAFEKLEYDEVARQLGCTEEAARWRVYNARRRLALLLRLDPTFLDP